MYPANRHYCQPQSPAQLYHQSIDQGLIQYDTCQQQAVAELTQLFAELAAPYSHRKQHQGLYLWGKVGRGKTFLMDLFCEALTDKRVLRTHFHRFMAWVHQRLHHYAGRKNPLKLVAKDIAHKHRVLCFDELFVNDIGDAVLLGPLFQYLFKQQVTLVATSNTAITDLYRDGLQQARFIPARQSLLANTRSLHLDGKEDHRTRSLQHTPIYFSALPEKLLTQLDLPTQPPTNHSIEVLGRRITTQGESQYSLCCSFEQLCESNRSHLDYIQLAQRYTDVVLINIPPLSGRTFEHIKTRGTEEATLYATETGSRKIQFATKDNAVRRFISLVDELYERKVNLYLVSQTPLNALYTEGGLLFEFQRTKSRLAEMASQQYLKLAHQP